MTSRYENYFNRNKELYSSHIERAVKLFEDIITYDPLLYSYFIKEFFKKNCFWDSNLLNAFWIFYISDVSSNRELKFYFCKLLTNKEAKSEAESYTRIEINLFKDVPSNEWTVLEFGSDEDLAEDTIKEEEREKEKEKEIENKLPFELTEIHKRFSKAADFVNKIPKLTGLEPDINNFENDFTEFLENVLSKPENREQVKSITRYIAFTNPEITFQERINIELFGNLMYSYLKGEYLILDNFSELLRKAKEKFKEADGQKQDVIKSTEQKRISRTGSQTFPEFPYALKSFVKLSLLGDEICSHIRRVLSNPHRSFVIINSDIEARVNSLCPEEFYIPHPETLYFEQLAESIINLTHIDHCFIKNKVNVQKIAILVDRLNVFEDTVLNNRAENHFLKTIVEITKYKAFTLFECLDRKYTINDPDLVNIVGNDKIGQEYQYDIVYSGKDSFLDARKYTSYSSKMEAVSKSNKFLLAKINNKDELLSYDDLIKDNKLRERLIYNSNKDIDLYNNSVELGISTYCEYSRLFEKLKSKKIIDEPDNKDFTDNRSHTFFIFYLTGLSKIIAEDLEVFRNKLNERTVAFEQKNRELEELYKLSEKHDDIQAKSRELINKLNSVLKELKKLKNTLSSNISKYNKLLAELNKFLEVYKYNVPHQYRPFFEYSFYKYDPKEEKVSYLEYLDPEDIRNYNCDKVFKDIFFFSSLGISPVPRKFLIIFYMEKINDLGNISEKYQESLLQLERFESIIITTEIREYNAAKVREGVEATYNQIDIAKRNQEERENIFKEDTGKLIDDQRRHTIQILGIFAAFLAFTTTTIGLVQIADNITEYIIFCAGFTLSLVFFVMLIKYNFIYECREQIEKLRAEYRRKNAPNPSAEHKVKAPWYTNCWHHIWAPFRTGPFLPMIILIITFFIFLYFVKDYFPDKKESNDRTLKNTYTLLHQIPASEALSTGWEAWQTAGSYEDDKVFATWLAAQKRIWK